MKIPEKAIIPEPKFTKYLLVFKQRNDKSKYLAKVGNKIMNIELYQEIALTHDIPQHNLKQGDIATLIDFVEHPTGGETGCILEIFNAVGESINILTVPISAVKPLTAEDILTSRKQEILL